MKISFVSLRIEMQDWDETTLGKYPTNHAYFGAIFNDREKAIEHQESMPEDQRAGVILAESDLLIC